VRVDGELIFNGLKQRLNAALAGFGIAYVPEDVAQPHVAAGRLKRLRIGARLLRDITSITRAGATPHRHSRCWLMPCANGVNAAGSASGEIFNEEFLKPLGLTAPALAKAIGVPMATVHFAAMTAALLVGCMAVRAKG
jgi:hypothetical protein